MIKHHIELEPTSLGNRGQRYRAVYAGAVMVESSFNPEFDACRVLLALGITGKLEVWRLDGVAPARSSTSSGRLG